MNIFLIQGIFCKILLTLYFNSSLSSSFLVCFNPSLFKFLSLKSIYLIRTSTGSFSIISICSGFNSTSSYNFKNENLKQSDILSIKNVSFSIISVKLFEHFIVLLSGIISIKFLVWLFCIKNSLSLIWIIFQYSSSNWSEEFLSNKTISLLILIPKLLLICFASI